MTRQSLGLFVLVFAALGAACGGDRIVGPDSRVLGRIEVTPASGLLFISGQDRLVLSTVVYDPSGRPILDAGTITYSSSAPHIAKVSTRGVVTAVKPGQAAITASLTLGGVTRADSMSVTVYLGDFWDVYGVYDLNAPIATFDPAWGFDLTGYRYSAVVTLWVMWDPPWLVEGRFTDLRFIGPGGETEVVADTGTVTSSFDPSGRLIIELVGNQRRIGLVFVVASLAEDFIDGNFGCCGHIGGTFTAKRRQP